MTALYILFNYIAILIFAGLLIAWGRSLYKQKRIHQRWQLPLGNSNQGLWARDIQTNQAFSARRWKEVFGFTGRKRVEPPYDWGSSHQAEEHSTQEQLQLTQQVIKNQSVATFVIDLQHRVLYWNRACEVLTGATEKDMLGSTETWRAFYPQPRPCLADMVLKSEEDLAEQYYLKQGPSALLERTGWHAEDWFNNLGGKRRYVIFDAAPIYDANGKVSGVIETLQDVTENKLAEQALIKEKLKTEQVQKSLEHQKYALDQHSIVARTNVTGIITYVNDKFCDISGYSREELIGKDHILLNSGQHPKGFFKEMYRTVAMGNTWHGEVCNRNKSGDFYWVDTTIVPFMNEDGKPIEYIAIRTDITDRKRAEDEANKLANYDNLTGLPNRRLLLERMSHALTFSKRNQTYGAVMFLDLNNFKTLNDTKGHDVGDMLLQQVASRLKSSFREVDTVARLGGDEFVVVLNELHRNSLEAQNQVELIQQKMINKLSQPYDLDGYYHQSTISVGVCLLHHSLGGVNEIIKKADMEMYKVKSAKKATMLN